MKRLFSSLLGLVLAAGLAFGLGGCVTTGLPLAASSPWQPVALDTRSNPLDLAFTDDRHGFLVGSNRLILETEDGGASWQARALALPEDENFRLLSIDFNGKEGWIAGQPGLLLHSTDGGQNWERLLLDTKLPGDPYLITALDTGKAELATTVGAIYRTSDGGGSWQAEVSDAAGAVRDLRRAPDGRYVSVSSLGNFFATWGPGQATWEPHQRISSQRLQSMGFQPDGNLWMVTRGAQLRFNPDAADVEAWSKPVIPITNGYGYLDMAWDPNGAIWAGGGSGTLLVSEDGGSSWKRDPLAGSQPTNFTRIVFNGDGKGFLLGERGNLLRWVG
ncbi:MULTISPECIES: photosynthesis system II assembly factor Ycf48 [unclassified Synechococcus]|uniref:photosynthesis system II assembly factor Ycf48 n=1 Tax=unclassified Synechococcus TaxID=2626047 RepID=UPI00006999F8|nr:MULTISPECIES: photosynthesis system II assembly factor Ycf48 [unclassified Synechococcus]EAQ76392.1 plant photosystem II stability/assembly factor-like protein [Synechococcus sp. WH 5701]WFN59402.1 photosynthesis system II assembly factor Ycf48 [Synechococcus sp. CCFWC 502]